MILDQNEIVAAYIDGALRNLEFNDYSKLVKTLQNNDRDRLVEIFLASMKYMSLIRDDIDHDKERKDEIARIFKFLVYVLENVETIEDHDNQIIYLQVEDPEKPVTIENVTILVVANQSMEMVGEATEEGTGYDFTSH